jgi:hypothetical protein
VSPVPAARPPACGTCRHRHPTTTAATPTTPPSARPRSATAEPTGRPTPRPDPRARSSRLPTGPAAGRPTAARPARRLRPGGPAPTGPACPAVGHCVGARPPQRQPARAVPIRCRSAVAVRPTAWRRRPVLDEAPPVSKPADRGGVAAWSGRWRCVAGTLRPADTAAWLSPPRRRGGARPARPRRPHRPPDRRADRRCSLTHARGPVTASVIDVAPGSSSTTATAPDRPSRPDLRCSPPRPLQTRGPAHRIPTRVVAARRPARWCSGRRGPHARGGCDHRYLVRPG